MTAKHIPNNIDTLWSVTSNTTPNLASHTSDQKALGEEMRCTTNDAANLKVKSASYVVFIYSDTPAGVNDYRTDHLLNS